ncbi:MAG: Abi family protein [Cephaloticoccus sp.]|nr:Abi family protein [Cephaloticoccus sp.]MCF7759390.1 Abi family protein [Cephaloticoccus sp.]
MTAYGKPAMGLADLYAKIVGRGLTVATPVDLQAAVENLGYYRLAGYAYPFLVPPDRKVFKAGTTWEQIARVYEFDRELRLLVSDAIERIEVGLRARIITATTTAPIATAVTAPGAPVAIGGPHWFLDAARFHPQFNHAAFIQNLEREVGIKYHPVTNQRILPTDHAEKFIEHFYNKYDSPHLPPFWMVAEVLTLGSLSLLYKGLGDSLLKAVIANRFGITAKVMASWLHSLSHLRNICAHHGRLWNREFSITPKIPVHLAATVHASNRFEGQATVLVEMLRIIAPADDWRKEFRDLLMSFPEIDISAMGFGPSWSSPYWQS